MRSDGRAMPRARSPLSVAPARSGTRLIIPSAASHADAGRNNNLLRQQLIDRHRPRLSARVPQSDQSDALRRAEAKGERLRGLRREAVHRRLHSVRGCVHGYAHATCTSMSEALLARRAVPPAPGEAHAPYRGRAFVISSLDGMRSIRITVYVSALLMCPTFI